ncbi:MAG TPA: DM13 domain-containing protein [Acidimicrobiales bacterium]
MSRARTRILLSLALVLLVVAAVGLALFQPWKLWVDDKVDQAAPLGATPITAAPAPSAPPATTGEPAPGPATTPAAPSTAPPTAPPATPAATEFVSLDHHATGELVVLADEDGTRFVRFVDLATENGPDLKVYLSTNPVDGPEGAFDDEFVDLGRLKGNIGSQNYEVPAGVDLSRFRSVVIWCDRFNSAFGAAPLQ